MTQVSLVSRVQNRKILAVASLLETKIDSIHCFRNFRRCQHQRRHRRLRRHCRHRRCRRRRRHRRRRGCRRLSTIPICFWQ